MPPANVPSTTTSYRHDASTTSIGPRSAKLIECCQNVGVIDVGGSAPRASEPFLHRRPTREAGRLSSKELRNRQAGLDRPTPERGVDVVVEVPDLDRLGHLA